MSNTHVAKH